jgi:hypothetical protein
VLISFSVQDIIDICHAYTLHIVAVELLALAGKLVDALVSKPRN